MSVKNPHPEYNAMRPEWDKCRDAAIGERAVHAKREEYLPRLQDEEDENYELRLKMTPFFNASWRTIDGLRGIMFRKPPKTDVPESLQAEMADIDLAGSDINSLAQEIAEEALTVGRVGLMVDYPLVNIPGATRADVMSMGLRPFISMYKAETIINWKTSRVNGATILTMVVLAEQAAVDGKDEFDHATEQRYRVLDLFEGKYRQRVFKINDKGEDEVIEESFPLLKNAPLTFIPFVFIGVDSVSPEVDDPPLGDLINLNFKHYGQATSYERGCFFSGLPTMFVSGLEDDDNKIYIGGNVANAIPANAKAYYVEIAGNFEALRNNLEDKKREMAVLGARLLETQKQTAEAEGTVARRQVGEESTLAAMAQNISQGVTQVLRWYAQWQGVTVEVGYEINRSFLPVRMDAATLTAMVASWQTGAFSKETLFDNLKQGEIIAESVTFEEEEAKIENRLITPTGGAEE